MAIFKEYLTLSDFLDAKKPVDANNDTYYINDGDEAIQGIPDFKWNTVVFCKEDNFLFTRGQKYGSSTYFVSKDIFTQQKTSTVTQFLLNKNEQTLEYEATYNVLNNAYTSHFFIYDDSDSSLISVEVSKGSDNDFYFSYEDKSGYPNGSTARYLIGLKYNTSDNKFTILENVARQTYTWEILGTEYYLSCYAQPEGTAISNNDYDKKNSILVASGYKLNKATGKYSKLEFDDIKGFNLTGFNCMQSDGNYSIRVSTSLTSDSENKSDASIWYYWYVPGYMVITYNNEKATFSNISATDENASVQHPSIYMNGGRSGKFWLGDLNNQDSLAYLLRDGHLDITFNLDIYMRAELTSYNSLGSTILTNYEDPFPTSIDEGHFQIYLTTDDNIKFLYYGGEKEFDTSTYFAYFGDRNRPKIRLFYDTITDHAYLMVSGNGCGSVESFTSSTFSIGKIDMSQNTYWSWAWPRPLYFDPLCSPSLVIKSSNQ